MDLSTDNNGDIDREHLTSMVDARIKEIRELCIPACTLVGGAHLLTIRMMKVEIARAEEAIGSGDVEEISKALCRLSNFRS